MPPARRLENGRFAPGASANPARRFSRGQSGNPKGRPKGTFRAGTRAAAALLDAQAEALATKAIELALGGDPVAVRFCLGRILGVRRGQPVELDLPAIAALGDLAAALGDLAAAVGAITAAVADGGLTPDEALSLSQMLDGFPRILAAGPAGQPPEEGSAEDPRQVLIDQLDRMAAAKELRGEFESAGDGAAAGGTVAPRDR